MNNNNSINNYDEALSGDLLFEKSITPMMIVDSNRTIIKANRRFFDLFKYTAEEIIGMQTSVLTPSQKHFEEYRKYFQETMDGSYESSELLYKKKDGSLFWVKLRGIPLETGVGFFIIWSFNDITFEVRSKEEIKNRNKELEIIFDKVKAGLLYVVNGYIERANQSFTFMINETIDNIIGKRVTVFLKCFETCKDKGEKKIVTFSNEKGEYVIVEREIISIDDKSQIVVLSDVTNHVNEKELLTKMAQIDGLTGIYNRNTFISIAQSMINNINYEKISFVMFDIDNFKLINDSFGHDIGDDVLKEMTALIKHQLRQDEIFGRLGGEEFGIIFPVDKQSAGYICKRVLDAVRSENFTSKRLNVTVSMGLVDSSSSRIFETLYKEADKLLYKAKNAGRDTLFIAN